MKGLDNSYRLNRCRGKYDGISSILTTCIFHKWLNDSKVHNIPSSSYIESIWIDGIEFDICATLYFDKVEDIDIKGFEVLSSTGADPDDVDADGSFNVPYVFIDFAVNSEWLPRYWQEIYMFLADCVRHEIEHITQGGEDTGNYRAGKPNDDDAHIRLLVREGFLPAFYYLLLPKEVDANLQGLRFESKKRKEPLINTIHRYFDIKNLADSEQERVLEAWRSRAKKIGGIPSF